MPDPEDYIEAVGVEMETGGEGGVTTGGGMGGGGGGGGTKLLWTGCD